MPEFPKLPEALARLLTPREREVVQYLSTGKSNKVLALELNISMRTVEAHRARILRKLGAHSVLDLAARICHHGTCPFKAR